MKTSNSIPDNLTGLRIERIVPNGYGIGFADGLTVFTPLTAPGDVVEVNITQKKKKIAFAEVVRVLEPSAERVSVPPCKYFGTCGGCDFQQMNYTAQLAAKASIVRDCLKRIGKIDWAGELPVVASPHAFQYRSRAQWRLDASAKRIGYLKRNSHEVIDIETCPILVPELDAELRRLRTELPWEEIWDNNAKIDSAAGDDRVVSTYSDELNEVTNELVSKVGEDKFSYSARAFFQGNRYLAGPLVDAALGGASGDSAIDLYCGVGLFTLPMARKFGNVTAVEENDAAVEYAEKNAIAAKLDNIQFWAASVRSFLKSDEVKPVDFLLLDPPRSGAEPESILAVARLRPREISYVSCEPSILARDLRILIDHGYEIATITAFDLFPQTHHVETVVRLALS
ncbi:MAG: class I SAM-dependent RNA methyltransferase [Acidobacteriota bacterium]